MKLKPNMYKKSIYDIDYTKLKNMNKKYLFFDLDNTLISYKEENANQRIIDLFYKLKKMGFECILFSNSFSKRVKRVQNELKVDIYYNSMKPFKKNYIKIMKKYNKEECVFIGDQIMTDVLGAKRNNLFVILVDRIDSYEPVTTKFWRFFENIILKKYEKKKILIKGKYYD